MNVLPFIFPLLSILILGVHHGQTYQDVPEVLPPELHPQRSPDSPVQPAGCTNARRDPPVSDALLLPEAGIPCTPPGPEREADRSLHAP